MKSQTENLVIRLVHSKLGWQRHVHINELVKEVRGVGAPFLRIETGWERITSGEIDALWEEAGQSGKFILEKKSGYIFWRYRDNPERKYDIVLFRSLFGKDLKAYVVVCEQGNELRILDLIAPARTNVRKLMKFLEERAARKGLRAVRLWSNPNDMRCRELKDAGYFSIGKDCWEDMRYPRYKGYAR